MKKHLFTALAAAFLCLSLAGCASDTLKAEQQTESKALAEKQAADRQVERAQNIVAGTGLNSEAAEANLVAKQQQQQAANANLQAIFCPLVTQ